MFGLLILGLAASLAQPPVATEGGTVSGRVVEAGTRAPIARAQVVVVPFPQGPPQDASTVRPISVTTDEQGAFVVAGLAAGRYHILARKTGFAAVAATQGNQAVESATVNVSSGTAATPVNIALQRAGVIAGRVVDAGGEPLVDARVVALRRAPAAPPLPPTAASAATPFASRLLQVAPGTMTNDLGEFRLHSLPPGSYVVQVTFEGGRGFMVVPDEPRVGTLALPTFYPGTADVEAAQWVSVASGQIVPEVVVHIVTATAYQVTGVVTDENGLAFAGAMVRLLPKGAPGGMPAMPSPLMQARTDARGAFVLPAVTSGSYTLLAVAPVVLANGASPGAGSQWSSGATGSFVVGGPGDRSRMVTTETRNGTTVQYRDDTGTEHPIVVSEANVWGVQVTLRRPTVR